MWTAWDKPGLGHLRLAVRDSGVVADGLVLGVAEGCAFRIAYEVRCDADWRVRATRVGVPLDRSQSALPSLNELSETPSSLAILWATLMFGEERTQGGRLIV
jgi:hypothetical protein